MFVSSYTNNTSNVKVVSPKYQAKPLIASESLGELSIMAVLLAIVIFTLLWCFDPMINSAKANDSGVTIEKEYKAPTAPSKLYTF